MIRRRHSLTIHSFIHSFIHWVSFHAARRGITISCLDLVTKQQAHVRWSGHSGSRLSTRIMKRTLCLGSRRRRRGFLKRTISTMTTTTITTTMMMMTTRLACASRRFRKLPVCQSQTPMTPFTTQQTAEHYQG